VIGPGGKGILSSAGAAVQPLKESVSNVGDVVQSTEGDDVVTRGVDSETVKIMRLKTSDLKNFKKYREPKKEGDFSLMRARFLAEMAGLSYAAGSHWASMKPGEGDFTKGVAGLSLWCKHWVGCHKNYPNDFGVVPLDSTFDKEWEWKGGRGTMRDGLISYTRKLVDTQAMILIRREEKEVIVVFRGTQFEMSISGLRDMTTDIAGIPVLRKNVPVDAKGRVHAGFYAAWQGVEETIVQTVRALVGSGAYDKVYVAGHSLGGSLATFGALALVEQIPGIILEVYTFGGAISGMSDFRDYYNVAVKGFWRVVNDKDIIPRLGCSVGYRHVGQTVFINSERLWILGDLDAVQCDSEGGVLERLSDHYTTTYSRLLDLFQATWVAQDAMKAVEEAWKAFLRCDDQLPKQALLTVRREEMAIVSIVPPSTLEMSSILELNLGLTKEQVALIQPEMFRLRWWYRTDTVDWSIFAIAIYSLVYNPNERYKRFRQYCAKLREAFAKWDLDCDEFLDWEEFKALCKDELLIPNCSEEEVAITFAKIVSQFQALDVAHDRKISFAEYAAWRSLGKRGKLSGDWFPEQRESDSQP